MTISQEEMEVFQRLKDDFIHYASRCLKIRTKNGSVEFLQLNKAQLYIHNCLQEQKRKTGKVRALILKGRQQGCSTYVGGRFYHLVTHTKGCQAFILTHALDATSNLYQMAKRFYEHTPIEVKPSVSKSNAKELIFGRMDSGYKLGTAENKRVGRSSTIQLLHGSEVGFWNNAADHATGIMQAVPNTVGTEIILESTANGVGNYFHQEWQKAESGLSDFMPIFVPWFWQEEYRERVPDGFTLYPEEEELIAHYGIDNEQVCFRRKKIIELSANGADGAKAFNQEYPMCAADAFVLTGEDNYISPDIVINARKESELQRIGPLLIGCDPARFGEDRSCIIRRRGRVAWGLESYSKYDTMQIAGILYKIIVNEPVVKCFIDSGGLGAGVVDRLKELVPNPDVIVAVNFGSKPIDGNKYRNKRSEMWGEMRAWLEDGPVNIPDSDELQADLCNTKYRVDSNNRLEMESKDHMKKRGVRSSDMADALGLTFALPGSAITASTNNDRSHILSGLADSFDKQRAAILRSRR